MFEFFELSFIEVFLLLIFAHCLADYPLQGDFLAQGKNRNSDIGKVFWPHALSAHAIIHGGFVGLITGSWVLFILESVIHGLVDWFKCEGLISMRADQSAHYLCKVVWAMVAVLAI